LLESGVLRARGERFAPGFSVELVVNPFLDRGVMAVLAFQSVADLLSVLRPAGAQQILDNTNTKLWFRATDYATAKAFADVHVVWRSMQPFLNSPQR
jgi:hypothetical protein